MYEQQLTEKEVFMFLFNNSEDTEMMDKINKFVFPYTSAYQERFGNKKDTNDIVNDFVTNRPRPTASSYRRI